MVGIFTHFGWLIFLLLTGMTINISMVLMTGKKGLYTGVASLLMLLLYGLLGVAKLGAAWHPSRDSKLALVNVAALQSIIHFPSLLASKSWKFGRLGLFSAPVGDVLSMFLQLISTTAINGVKKDKRLIAIGRVLGVLVHLAFVIKVIQPAMNWIIRRTPEGRLVKNVYVYAIILYFLTSSLIFHLAGLSSFLAPFILGLAIPDGPPLGANLVGKLDCFTLGVLLPLFITTRVMKANFSEIHFSRDFLQVSSNVTALIVVAKFVGFMVPSLALNLP